MPPNEENHEFRRSTDQYIFEMHGMLCEMKQKLEDHIKRDEDEYKRTDAIDQRLRPIEHRHRMMSTFGKIFLYIVTPVLVGAGGLLWDKIHHLFQLLFT